jgi:hypothetical protein
MPAFRPSRSGGLLVLLAAAACSGSGDLNPRWPTGNRERELLALAAREAADIADPDARLTRQLNIADAQVHRVSTMDGVRTLRDARRTIAESGEKLGEDARLAGWVSISQLARAAQDRAAAESACHEALERLQGLPGEARRCQYVLGVANEAKHLVAEKTAVELLTLAGGWAKSIEREAERHQALLAFAVALFNLDRTEDAIAVLRNEPDAAWRSDTLAMLASSSARGHDRAQGLAAQHFYGQQLDYEFMFKGRTESRKKPR